MRTPVRKTRRLKVQYEQPPPPTWIGLRKYSSCRTSDSPPPWSYKLPMSLVDVFVFLVCLAMAQNLRFSGPCKTPLHIKSLGRGGWVEWRKTSDFQTLAKPLCISIGGFLPNATNYRLAVLVANNIKTLWFEMCFCVV